jgi:hypothetical protein
MEYGTGLKWLRMTFDEGLHEHDSEVPRYIGLQFSACLSGHKLLKENPSPFIFYGSNLIPDTFHCIHQKSNLFEAKTVYQFSASNFSTSDALRYGCFFSLYINKLRLIAAIYGCYVGVCGEEGQL